MRRLRYSVEGCGAGMQYVQGTDGTLGMSDLRGTESKPGNSWAFRGSARDDAVVSVMDR